MKFFSRRLVKHEDLNPADRLFGGRLLAWIDEEAAIYAACQLHSKRIVTKFISEINFVAPGDLGDVIEFGLDVVSLGTSSITLSCEVRNKENKQPIIRVDKMVFVCLDTKGKPQSHGIVMSDPFKECLAAS
ncbi:hotdog domain-containing protein [Dasania marina]|uniref:acyl-CoA thioesterase n=1 Tax=Dasania marina TaxID=471499 RepID=UPI0030D7B91E|tara:strand:+ start:10765 stop:11157 length:393 start_codon:yes stop_codon:yes gene_type:complete